MNDNHMQIINHAFMQHWPCEYTPPNHDPIPVWISGITWTSDMQRIEILPQQEGAFANLENAIHMSMSDFIIFLPGMKPYSFIKLQGSEIEQVTVVVESDSRPMREIQNARAMEVSANEDGNIDMGYIIENE